MWRQYTTSRMCIYIIAVLLLRPTAPVAHPGSIRANIYRIVKDCQAYFHRCDQLCLWVRLLETSKNLN